MKTKQPSLRDLLKGTPGDDDNGPKLPVLPSPPADSLLTGMLAHAQPMYAAGPDGNIHMCSTSFTKLMPQLFKAPHNFDDIIASVQASEEPVPLTDRVEQDGTTHVYRSRHFALRDDAGNITGYFGLYEDITSLSNAARKASDMENWLQDVIRSTSDWVWSTDHNYNLIFISPRISDVVNVPAQSLTGRYLLSLGEFDADDEASAKTRADMAQHAPFRNRIFLITGQSGKTHRIHLSGVPVFDDDSGRFCGYRGTGTDVTAKFEAELAISNARSRLENMFEELRKRNDELRIALEKSKVAKKSKDDFLATMSHELKTPLNSIMGFSDAAAKEIHGPLNDAYAGYFANIHKAGTHLLSIINGVLDAASIDQQDVVIENAELSAREVVNEAVALAGANTHGRHIDVSKLGMDEDFRVIGDHTRIRQILVNLIGNAVKFTPAGGSVGIDATPLPGDRLAITVWDTGVGIPIDEQPRVFDKFYRVERNAQYENGEGTGLGLAISRHLARLMEGELTLTSIPGEGSRFTLTLPTPPID